MDEKRAPFSLLLLLLLHGLTLAHVSKVLTVSRNVLTWLCLLWFFSRAVCVLEAETKSSRALSDLSR